ncbi:MAG: sigma-70 family RNA polymerase sigma factor [Myxococcota bacterium]
MSDPVRVLAALEHESDEELVARVLVEEREAFDALYDRYMKRVYGFVYKRLGNRSDTEELVQEVFLSVFASLSSFRGESSFASWVLGIARRTVANRFKKPRAVTVPLGVEDEVGALESSTAEPPMTPLEHYEYLERIAQLDQNVQQSLNRNQQRLFRLHHIEHRSIAEIADELGKTQNSIKSNLYRTRKLLLNP